MIHDLTRPQDAAVERLACEHGRVCVRRPLIDEPVQVTVPGGQSWTINVDGRLEAHRPDHSVDWSYKI